MYRMFLKLTSHPILFPIPKPLDSHLIPHGIIEALPAIY